MSWFQSLIFGQDLDAEEQRGKEYDAKLKALEDKRRSEGLRDGMSEVELKAIDERFANGAKTDYSQDVWEEFGNAAKENIYAAADSVGAVGNTIGGAIWRAIPWWVWLVGLVWLAWEFGLLGLAKRKIAAA